MTPKPLTSVSVNLIMATPAVALASGTVARFFEVAWPAVLFIGAFCMICKRRAIGGWLLFFYISVYLGTVVTAITSVRHMGEIVPPSLVASENYSLIKSVSVQSKVLVFVTALIATFLLFSRTREMLNLLRWAIGARMAVSLVSAFAYSLDFPDQGANSFMKFIAYSGWLAYLLLSRRVKHVFVLNDWDVAMRRNP